MVTMNFFKLFDIKMYYLKNINAIESLTCSNTLEVLSHLLQYVALTDHYVCQCQDHAKRQAMSSRRMAQLLGKHTQPELQYKKPSCR